MGREQFHKLESAYRVLLLHMLKWDFHPERRSRSWAITIMVQRQDAAQILADNPGLRSRIDEASARAFRRARLEAAIESGLKPAVFPTVLPIRKAR